MKKQIIRRLIILPIYRRNYVASSGSTVSHIVRQKKTFPISSTAMKDARLVGLAKALREILDSQ